MLLGSLANQCAVEKEVVEPIRAQLRMRLGEGINYKKDGVDLTCARVLLLHAFSTKQKENG